MLLLLACTSPLPLDSHGATEPRCARLDAITPEHGATEVDPESAIEVRFDAPVEDARIRVEGVLGSVSTSDLTRWTWRGELVGGTQYAGEVSWCEDAQSAPIGFATRAMDTSQWADRSWRVVGQGGTVVVPEALGALLEAELDQALVEVVGTSIGQIEVAVAVATGAQEPCMPTVRLDTTLYEDGRFEGWAEEIDTPVFHAFDVSWSGTASADGLDAIALSFTLDTVALIPLLGLEEADDEAVCELIAGFGVACEPCPSGSERCVPVALEGLEGAAEAVTVIETESCLPACEEDGECQHQDCGCASGPRGAPLLLLLPALLLWRRSDQEA